MVNELLLAIRVLDVQSLDNVKEVKLIESREQQRG